MPVGCGIAWQQTDSDVCGVVIVVVAGIPPEDVRVTAKDGMVTIQGR